MKTLLAIVLVILSTSSFAGYNVIWNSNAWYTTINAYKTKEYRTQVRFDIYTCNLGITRANLYYLNYMTNTLILEYNGSLMTIPADMCKFTIEQGRSY